MTKVQRMRNIDPALLRAFLAVAETGGMTKAGRLLHLTQAAVSQQVKRLEELLGHQLFLRDRAGLPMTPAGERLLPRAQRLLALHDEIWALMTAPDFAGEVRLGVPLDLLARYMPPVLKSFDQAWPAVRVSLVADHSMALLAALERQELDLALTTEAACGPQGEILLDDALIWLGAPNGQAWRRTPLPLSIGDERCAFRQPVLRALADAGRDWRPVCELSNMEALCATAAADLAVTAFLASTAPERLEPVPPEAGLPPLPVFKINLYLAQRSPSTIARALAAHLRTQFAARYQRAA